ncbi:antitoxin [Canibacter zhoujuaniae]|uniref:antitoxin n=1 Tax=Canibacter zhoujuaniae TaxID=2708343 RepID=UPI001AB04F3C|nr:antitoxin [Canibacter zhoujuaniae]
MGLEDLKNKAANLINENKEKIDAALNSEQAEAATDKVLDGAANIANKVTGGKFADKIAEARDAADEKLGRNDSDSSGNNDNAS